MRRNTLIALLIVLAASGAAFAGRFNKVLSVGDAAPSWLSVAGTDDKQHGLDDYKSAKVVVAVFTCNHCPVAQQYEDRLIQLQKDYQDKGVQVIALCVNTGDEDSLAAMKERATAKEFNFPYLSDPTQAAGRLYGAQKTPEAFVLDGNRKVVYMGAIDDSWADATTVKKPYLRNAIDAVLAGRTPDVQEMRATGCGIEYSR